MNNTAPAGPILIVDDVPENLEILGKILGDAGHAVRVANSGATALRYADLQPQPELILLDIMMPGMDGYEVLRQLRQQESTRHIPVLFLTALGDPQDVVEGLRLGAADYIAKPAQSEVVLARVRTQLEAKRVRDWLRDRNAVLEAEVRRRVEEAQRIREEADRVQAVLNHQRELILAAASDGIFGIDNAGAINFVNPAGAALLGYAGEELVGRRMIDILRPALTDEPCEACIACAAGIEVHGREITVRRKDGCAVTLELSCRPILEGGERAGAVLTLRDQSERRRYLEQLERKSNFDDLTGLPNRNLLHDRLGQAIGRCRSAGHLLAVLNLSLDRFQAINDSLGHQAAEQALVEIARRLAAEVAAGDTLARLEGPEFALVAEVTEVEAATRLAQGLLAVLETPLHLEEHEFFLGGSIGIAIHPKDGDDGEALLHNAAAAMCRARTAGGQRFNFYAAEMHTRSLERLDLENSLRRAIDRGELVVHYQPQVSLRTGEIIGAEALVRWQHPSRGLVMPDQFIGLAEESGLIVPLGEWVLRAACAQNKAWQDEGLPAISVAVNMSARQFVAQDIVKLAGSVLADTGLDPAYLELELTESVMMSDAEAFIRATDQLKGLSIQLSIDDFGTGFSSLNYLKRFAVDRLKIDRSFIRDITYDANSAAIALAVISLAHSMKLSVIAEGVETEAQLAFLRRRDCDEVQGYYFSRPVPAGEFAAMLRQRRRMEFPASAPLPDRTLLLVDDEPNVLSSLKRLFRREGYRVLSADSGMAGLEVLAREEVGVVLSDARMAGMSGSEFLAKAREMHPDVVRMMLSGFTDLKAVTEAVNSGELYSFQVKPWDDTELLHTVREAFRHYEARAARNAGSQ